MRQEAEAGGRGPGRRGRLQQNVIQFFNFISSFQHHISTLKQRFEAYGSQGKEQPEKQQL